MHIIYKNGLSTSLHTRSNIIYIIYFGKNIFIYYYNLSKHFNNWKINHSNLKLDTSTQSFTKKITVNQKFVSS